MCLRIVSKYIYFFAVVSLMFESVSVDFRLCRGGNVDDSL